VGFGETKNDIIISFLYYFNTFFSHLANFSFTQKKICLLECYKNMYGLHKFPIENYSIPPILHLFSSLISHLFSHLTA